MHSAQIEKKYILHAKFLRIYGGLKITNLTNLRQLTLNILKRRRRFKPAQK